MEAFRALLHVDVAIVFVALWLCFRRDYWYIGRGLDRHVWQKLKAGLYRSTLNGRKL